MQLITPELQQINESKAAQIRSTFEPMAAMLESFEKAYNALLAEAEKEITKDVTAKAKRLRIDIGRVRIETEKVRKEQKEEYLRAGKAIDGVSNILKWAVAEKEDKLKDIENYFEIQEQKRIEALQMERAEMLSKYVDDANERNLGEMEADVWELYFEGKKKAWEDEQEAIRKAEEERQRILKIEALHQQRLNYLSSNGLLPYISDTSDLGEIEQGEFDLIVKDAKAELVAYEREQEAIRKENERLRKEAEEAAKKAEAERKAREAKERKEREAYEARLKAEREERDRIEREERAKREKLEAELKAKQDAERKAREEEEARLQAELNKGDADKVNDLIADLEVLKTKYAFKSAKNKKMYAEVGVLLDKIVGHIKSKS